MTVVPSAATLVACADGEHEHRRAVQRVLLCEQGPFVLPGTVAERPTLDEHVLRAIRPLYGDAFTLLPADA